MRSSARPMVIAHRGASGYRPEHTRAAFELAFDLGADAVEPDIVPTSDGVLVIRHENEIGRTTDVARHPEFASRETTKMIDGVSVTGWFTEDFTWAELSTLRAIERLPKLRSESASFDGTEGILRLSDLREMIASAEAARGRKILMVAELKHPTYFESIGLSLDDLFAYEMMEWATAENLVIESFEQSVLEKLRVRGVSGRLSFLAEATGSPADLVARDGSDAKSYAELLTPVGLAALADSVDGISVNKKFLLKGLTKGSAEFGASLVADAHRVGLAVFAWTLRAENSFLSRPFRDGADPSAFGNWRGEFRRVIGTGIDAVFADQPDLAFEAIALADAAQ